MANIAFVRLLWCALLCTFFMGQSTASFRIQICSLKRDFMGRSVHLLLPPNLLAYGQRIKKRDTLSLFLDIFC
jgi:hypothetical protein